MARKSATNRWLSGMALLLLCALGLAAQDTTPAAGKQSTGSADKNTDEEIRFRSLEIYEQKDALAGILRRMAAERDSRRQQAQQLVALANMAKNVPKQIGEDEQTLSCIKLRQGIRELGQKLRESYLSCLGVLDAIQQQAISPSLSTDGAKLLRESERELRAIIAQQQKDSNKVRRLNSHVRQLIRAIPPPKRFVNQAGIAMVRVGERRSVFYVSEEAVSADVYKRFLDAKASPRIAAEWDAHADTSESGVATAVTWHGAKHFCRWLSEQEQETYKLPTPGHCSVLKSRGMQLQLATWLDDLWKPSDYVLQRELKRFAVDFAVVWDPKRLLSTNGTFFGELPFARYETLGFYVVTDANTGLQQRWHRLKATLE